MDFDTDFFFEIQDAPGEIYDLPEMDDSDEFNWNEYLNAGYDY